jgi:hypothetical protein
MKILALAVPLVFLPFLSRQDCAQEQAADCTACDFANIDQAPAAELKIRWKRAVVPAGEPAGGKERTAPRHARAEEALDAAAGALAKALTPLGVTVSVQKVALKEEDTAGGAPVSNRIWLNGVALENVLPEARTGRSVGDDGVALRTLEFAGRSFTDVPSALIVQAGLVAAGDSVEAALAELQAFVRGGGRAVSLEPDTVPAATATGCCSVEAGEARE